MASMVGAGARGRQASASTCWRATSTQGPAQLAQCHQRHARRADDRHGRARLYLRRHPVAGRHRRGMALLELRLRLDARRASRARSARRARRCVPACGGSSCAFGACCCSPLAAIGTSAAFAWPRGVQELVIAATLFVLVLRFAWVVVALVLAPGQPRLRLVPVANGRAGALAAIAMAVVFLFAFGRLVPELIERLTGAAAAAGALRFAGVTLACVLLLATAFAFFGRRSRAPRFPALLRPRLAGGGGLRGLAAEPDVGHDRGDRRGGDRAAGRAARAGVLLLAGTDGTMQDRVLPSIVLSAARFVVVLAGLALGALVLEAPLASLAAAESPLVRLSLRLVGVATLALLTHVVWITVRTAIDQRLSRVPPPGAHRGPDASARLLTLLPLLRVTAAVLLVVMLVLSSLWALGLEITPVLAGAGVVGLALGFGAQALVRDVIAGVFFLAEDAFRDRRVHRERHQHQGHGRAHHAAHRGAAPPQRPAALRALRRARHGAQYLARLGGGEIQPAAADRRRQREDPQAHQEGGRGNGRRPGARAADPRAAERQALPRRPRRKNLPLQVPHRARASSSTCARRPTSASRPRSPSSASASPMASKR